MIAHALFDRETPQLQKCFALFGPDRSGGVDRARLVHTGRLLKPVVPAGQWERFERRLDAIATGGGGGAVGFNEFGSLLRIVDLGGGGGGGVTDLVGQAKKQAAAAAALHELTGQVPPRLRKRCRTMRLAMEVRCLPPHHPTTPPP